jgi:hypothetical protein
VRTVTVPDELGSFGMTFAADVLEDEADRMAGNPMFMQSLQQVADFLRQVAAQVPEAATDV